MSEPFLAEIRVFGFNFNPRGWAFCNGQLVSIAQYAAVFSLLGTYYGGNGTSNFALPNLQGSAAMHWGQGPGLSQYVLGETGGSQDVTLLSTEMPQHSHTVNSLDGGRISGQTGQPGNAIPAKTSGTPPSAYVSGGSPNQQLAANALSIYGGGQPHNNMMPYLTMNFCIALNGIFPARN
jgi:microcystin-dependent protein